MEHFYRLLSKLNQIYPDDWWLNIVTNENIFEEHESFYLQAKIYDRVIGALDESSLMLFEEKAIIAFKQNSPKRGKQSFFNHLNELIAYEYLTNKGYKNVQLLQERTIKTPDISFEKDKSIEYCEVKTIGVSDEEISRWNSNKIIDGIIYSKLNDNYFNKLSSTIDAAKSQLHETSTGLVFIIMHFDDSIKLNYSTYKKQLEEYLIEYYKNIEICIQFDIFRNEFIHHKKSLTKKMSNY